MTAQKTLLIGANVLKAARSIRSLYRRQRRPRSPIVRSRVVLYCQFCVQTKAAGLFRNLRTHQTNSYKYAIPIGFVTSNIDRNILASENKWPPAPYQLCRCKVMTKRHKYGCRCSELNLGLVSNPFIGLFAYLLQIAS